MSIQLEELAYSRFLVEEYRPPSPSNINDMFPQSTSFGEDVVLDNIQPLWKRSLFALLERPTSSPPAFLVYAMTTALIIVSALITVLETVPAFHSISARVWFGIETSLVALFTVEYLARCLAWSNTWKSLCKWTFCQLLFLWFFFDRSSPDSDVAQHFMGLSMSFQSCLTTSKYCFSKILWVFRTAGSSLDHVPQSILFRFSILRMFRLLRVFRPFRYTHTILLWVFPMHFRWSGGNVTSTGL